MNKTDLINAVAPAANLDRATVEKCLDATTAVIRTALAEEKSVKFHGLGTFKTNFKEARPGRNPKTGEDIQIPARMNVKFTPSSELKDTVNHR